METVDLDGWKEPFGKALTEVWRESIGNKLCGLDDLLLQGARSAEKLLKEQLPFKECFEAEQEKRGEQASRARSESGSLDVVSMYGCTRSRIQGRTS